MGLADQSNGKIVMATVKGDVHDIGKNIVGVVLQCNGYEVIDLGVMVPAEKIIQTAKEVNADVIGLSGLITPSLEEMRHVAAEMERQGMNLPILIGGATTSKIHTAVKIEPNYKNGPTIHVVDASRAVGVVSNLLGESNGYVNGIRDEYAKLRTKHAGRQNRQRLVPIESARANKFKADWTSYQPPVPSFTGIKVFDNYSIAELRNYIDWTPFFRAWELAGKFPRILQDDVVGETAQQLYNDAQAMLDCIEQENWLDCEGCDWFLPGE